MRVAFFSLLRDRLLYTKTCFSTLRDKAGYSFDHYIVDNGSEDGTVEWIFENKELWANCLFNPVNFGLCIGNNQALQMIRNSGVSYDLIVKCDNDAEVISDNIVAEMAELYSQLDKPMLLSPRIEGIKTQPARRSIVDGYSHPIGVTHHIGGLFAWCNADVYLSYTYPDNLPKAKGDDSAFAFWMYEQGYVVGYVEDLVVNHYEGTDKQCQRFPAYFERKWKEEEEVFNAETA